MSNDSVPDCVRNMEQNVLYRNGLGDMLWLWKSYRGSRQGQDGYWGIPCEVVFAHQGQQVVHRGLVMLSQPMCQALRRTRAAQLRALRQELHEVRAKIGQPQHRTPKQVQGRAEACCRRSPVGSLLQMWTTVEEGQVRLHWALQRAEDTFSGQLKPCNGVIGKGTPGRPTSEFSPAAGQPRPRQ
jgi:hypothetical protein